MSSSSKRHTQIGAVLLLALLPGSAAPQEEAREEPAAPPVLYYSVGERSPDFEGDLRQLAQQYKQAVEKADERITVSVFNELFGAEAIRSHWFEAVPDVFSLRFIVQAWGDSDVQLVDRALNGVWVPGSYREAVLVPCAAVPAQAPVYKTLILVHQTARAHTTEYASAKAAAIELADYVNAERDDVWVQLYENLLGDFGTFHWFARTADLATWHRAQTALHEDPKYQELFERTFSHFVEGSLQVDWGVPVVGP